MNRFVRLFVAVFLMSGLLLTTPVQSARAAATFTVNSINDIVDANPGNGVCATSTNVCTLRAAVMEANSLAGADVIVLEPRRYTLTIDGNSSADNDDSSASGDLDITDTLTIQVSGVGMATIQGRAWTERILENFSSDPGLTLNNIIIKFGNTSETGGGLLNAGFATLNNVIVENNTSVNDGGGISNIGTLTLINSIVRNNLTTDSASKGGGIHHSADAVLTISATTISGNTSSNGGGMFVTGNEDTPNASVVTGSTISGNLSRGDGGGIFVSSDGQLQLINVTVSGNFANDDGGGLYGAVQHDVLPRFKMASVTVTKNTADADGNNSGNGGGLGANSLGTSAFLIKNSIIADNADLSPTASAKKPDCSAHWESAAYNLMQNTTGCTISGDTTGNILGANPLLNPLQNNGGLTLTHLPTFGPGLDAANPNGCTDFNDVLLQHDQRLAGRHQGPGGGPPGRCDMGAVELVQPA